ncbi:DNA gyrase subunit A [Candidatus Woesearchaeota archaeon]|nr:DNA gyrase subunit A [Candidatus Woesearchaeota archaeon]
MTDTAAQDRTKSREIEEEMRESYLNYAMSVIVGRALPDVRDGLKPVHRRILYAMSEMGMTHNKPFKKSARVVGTVLGQYHPHGDTAVYDALVRLAQDFSLRYPLIQGQGNFGCFTGDIKVRLADGRSLSFKELIREHLQGKKNFAYTINDEGRIEMGEILHPRLTKRQQRILKILLDNGKEIRCTLDHKFMLRDGTYKEAQYLTPNDSLMPLNFRLSTEKKESEPLIIDYDPIPLAEVYNHKIIQLNFLDKREDVYDLTIAGTHNFALAAGIFVHNSIDGDSPAAMRYTECRLQKMAEDLLDGINEETVDFVDNFDGSLKEPAVLPSKIPNLLVNGSAGIAVGMATSIPPHNLSEVADAIVTMIDTPAIDTAGLLSHIQGPDFPTGGIICGRNGIVNAYSTGRGRIIVRAKYSVEQRKGRPALIFTEIPYLVNKAETVAQIADLVRDKKIIGVSDLRDESDREGLRVVIELKQDANPEVVANQLFQHSRMQVTFSVILLALAGNRPRVLTLRELVEQHLLHQKEVVTRKTRFELRKSEERAHILVGIITALNDVDRAVKLIKESKAVQDARLALISAFSLTEIQANAILDLKLQKLATLEQKSIRDEHASLVRRIAELKGILADEKKVYAIIRAETLEMKKAYGDARRTEISGQEMMELNYEDLVEEQDQVVTITARGYIKRQPIDAYRQQKRGGIGMVAANTKEEDVITDIFIANTHSSILFFTDKGNVHWLKCYLIPEGSRQAAGKAIVNLVQLEHGEHITAHIPVKEFREGLYLSLVTKQGIIKKTALSAFANPRKGGIIAINLNDEDRLIDVVLTDGTKQLLIATKDGMAVKFHEEDARPVGRNSIGVRGIRLQGKDEVIGVCIADDSKTLLTLTENGYGKRSPVSDYRLINRGGSGVINIITNERNGGVVAVMPVDGTEQIMTITGQGIAARMPVDGISVIGRNTQGVRIMKLREDDKVVSATKIIRDEA